ncbi:MAG TPA: hypothetical protein VGF50_01260 [Caulobacteraceae bacterium]|jgi:hypothetical protein
MRRVLLTAVAVAPLLALAGVAEAACPTAGQATGGSDITIDSGCTVSPKAGGDGVILDSNNKITINSGGAISNTDASNTVGILIHGGNKGSVDNEGAISLLMSFTPKAEGNTGIAGGPFATGSNRVGIEVADGVFDGNILNNTTGTITIDGDNSTGILIQSGASMTGDLVNDGAISLTGNNTVGIDIAGAVGGNVSIGSTVSALGVGARGVVTSAPIGGQLLLNGTVTSTGYRSTTAPTIAAVLNTLGKDQVQQGGPAVTVGGNVAHGVTVAGAVTTGSGTTATTTAAAVISEFGSAPALIIGEQKTAITIGNNAADPFGLVVGGTVQAAGVYDKQTTPSLPGPVSATAIQLGNVDLTGGVHVTGGVAATSLSASATAIEIDSGVTAGQIVNDGAIAAATSSSTAQTVNAIIIAPGSSIGGIVNRGTISAVISNSATTGGTIGAIIDQSGSLTSIDNSGLIVAAATPTEASFVFNGSRTAIDVSASTHGVAITQTGSTSFQGQPAPQFTGSVAGTTLTVSNVASGNLVVGMTLYGPGIAPGTTITGEVTGTGGKGTYTISTSQTVSSESLFGAGPAPNITGDVILGKGANRFDIEAGTTVGGLSEQAGERNLTIAVAPKAGEIASVDITKAETHQVTTLNVGAGGTLQAAVDPTFAIGASNPTAIFDTTVHPGQAGPDGTATFANGAKIGVSLDALQTAPSATYVFVQTSGAPGALNIASLPETGIVNSPFLYTASVAATAADLDVTLKLKSTQELGLNASGAAAFDAIFQGLEKNVPIADAIIAQTTKYGFLSLYNQLVPDQGIGTFESLESATQKIANLTEQTPDAGTRIAGTSAWLQEVNQTIKRNDAEALGSTARMFGLVGGYEKMGAAGGALGISVAYLNIADQGTAEPVNARTISDMAELGAYYRRAWGDLLFSVRGGGGYAWVHSNRMFVTTGVNETSKGTWNGFFGDAHAGLQYEAHLGRFYVRPELSADYLYFNEDAHDFEGAGPGFDLAIARRTSERMTAAGLVTIGTQYGHDTWFRPEIFGGYRVVPFGSIANTLAQFSGGTPFILAPGPNVNGGWVVAGFSLRAGTPLSYVAVTGEADLKNREQRYNVYLSGRALF